MADTIMLGRSLALSLTLFACANAEDWPAYHGGVENTKYSKLDQITRQNVSKLRLAWRYDTGDAGEDTEMQCNPLIVRGVMYVTSPKLRVLALDAATGKLLWRFDPHGGKPVTAKFRNRGLNYWESGKERRIYFASGP
jgi:quinoprotein glucose dehydrogenase